MDAGSCELPTSNASPQEIDRILSESRTVAMVGLSNNPDRDSYLVASYLKAAGFRIVPVNPAVKEVLGELAYPDLAAIPAEVVVDVVDVFRKPEFVPEIVEQAIARGVKAVWLQRGIVHNAAAEEARSAGLAVVMDRCIKVEHARFVASHH